jgi:hypothetical protein
MHVRIVVFFHLLRFVAFISLTVFCHAIVPACRFLPSLCHYAASRQLREREQEWEQERAQEAAGKRAGKAYVAPCSMRIMQAFLKNKRHHAWVLLIALLHPFL